MPDTAPATINVESDVAAALEDPGTRARIRRLVSRVLQPAPVDRLIATMDAFAAEAERRGLRDEVLEAELTAYNTEDRERPPPT